MQIYESILYKIQNIELNKSVFCKRQKCTKKRTDNREKVDYLCKKSYICVLFLL